MAMLMLFDVKEAQRVKKSMLDEGSMNNESFHTDRFCISSTFSCSLSPLWPSKDLHRYIQSEKQQPLTRQLTMHLGLVPTTPIPTIMVGANQLEYRFTRTQRKFARLPQRQSCYLRWSTSRTCGGGACGDTVFQNLTMYARTSATIQHKDQTTSNVRYSRASTSTIGVEPIIIT